jgi:hypothetical protein
VLVRNLRTVPAIPLEGDEVKIELEYYGDFLAPSNITFTAYFSGNSNDWGLASDKVSGIVSNGIDLEMEFRETINGSHWYQTIEPIPLEYRDIDQVVQYMAVINFEGLNAASPKDVTDFTNPEWYHPIDLNGNGWGPFTPYYYVFSCLPGAVWINEVNLEGMGEEPDYVELCGVKGSPIGNWWLEVGDIETFPDYALAITNGTTMVDGTNSHAFYLFGAGGHPLDDPLPWVGGVSLMRSMGAVAHAVCFDDGYDSAEDMATNATYRFIYIGTDLDDTSLSAWGTGTYQNAFTNWNEFATPTPGSANGLQVFIPAPDPTNGPSEDITMEIGDISFVGGTQVWFQVEGSSSDLAPIPTYNTNLNYDVWVSASNQGFTVSNTVYDVWCDVVTNVPGAFYRIEFDDTP